MRRGTTPYVKLTCGSDWSKFKEVLFTMKDSKGNQVNKHLEDFEIEKEEEHTVLYALLTQDETLSFCPKSKLKVQVRVLDEQNNAYASPIFTMNIEDVIHNRVLKGGE